MVELHVPIYCIFVLLLRVEDESNQVVHMPIMDMRTSYVYYLLRAWSETSSSCCAVLFYPSLLPFLPLLLFHSFPRALHGGDTKVAT